MNIVWYENSWLLIKNVIITPQIIKTCNFFRLINLLFEEPSTFRLPSQIVTSNFFNFLYCHIILHFFPAKKSVYTVSGFINMTLVYFI